ncbi:MAG TPA: hypothetical protein VFP88_05265 [Rhodanobacteraceae bacterium]|nr:hypothetical protein [Rhodanobacteraceae bacterium]
MRGNMELSVGEIDIKIVSVWRNPRSGFRRMMFTKLTNGIDGAMTETLGYDAVDRLNSVASIVDNESFQPT